MNLEEWILWHRNKGMLWQEIRKLLMSQYGYSFLEALGKVNSVRHKVEPPTKEEQEPPIKFKFPLFLSKQPYTPIFQLPAQQTPKLIQQAPAPAIQPQTKVQETSRTPKTKLIAVRIPMKHYELIKEDISNYMQRGLKLLLEQEGKIK